MRYLQVGHSSLHVSAIGLGCMSMSGFYGKSDDVESIKVIRRALDLGVNFFDSADMYGWGHNEELLGKALGGRRERAVIATKFGQVQGEQGNYADGSPQHVARACDASLRRLGVETIDLYYLHRVDPKVPIEDTVGAMSRLVAEGKVRALGLSEAAPQTIRRAHAVHPLSAVETEYSLLYRNTAEQILPTCRELGVTFVAYSPLGRSLLTGGIHDRGELTEGDRRLQHPRFQGENLERNLAITRRIESFAAGKGVSASQLVLAWLLAQGKDIVPIPGTRRLAHLEENLAALDVRLNASDLARIAEAVPPGGAAGLRYPEEQMKTLSL